MVKFMKKPILIYGDFMKDDYENRLRLVCIGTFKDLEENKIKPKKGLKLVFYDDDVDENGNRDDLVVEGIVEYDEDNSKYAARIKWDEIKNISRLSDQEKENLGFE